MGRTGFEAQLGEAAPDQGGNLFAPVPGTQAARGRFTNKARDTYEIYSSRRADAVAAGLVLLGAVALRSLLRAPVRAARLLR
ncbi:MAG: hypothetical protein H7Z10_05730 [Gemmatimonadaceae bacterium]|nr:hypothetical protein [Acetobacteraceae bacterium]